jgi:tetratricopeptide (TPR) repeat protein
MRWKTLAVLLPAAMIANGAASAGDLARVRLLVEDGRPAEALTNLDEHLQEFPVDPEAMFLRALLLAEARREGEAREVFEEVATLRPDRPEPLNNLAVIQAALGDYDSAVETLKEALRTHPAYRTAYENLTKIYGQLASEAYSRALSIDGTHDRSSLELVLLSGMVLPEAVSGLAASTPAEPLPPVAAATVPESAAEVASLPGETAVGIEPAPDQDAEPRIETTSAPETPDQAIAEALVQEGGDVDPPKSVEAEPAERAEVPQVAPELSELALLVEAWAQAWSEQRAEDYLYFYSQGFRPAKDLSRDDWEELRRLRVAAPDFIKVSVAFLDFETSDPDRALVRFNQSYESDTFSDVVTKTLELVREGGSWKIASEFVE